VKYILFLMIVFQMNGHSSAYTGLTGEDRQFLFHGSQGSEIVPYDWLIRLKSAYERDKNLNWDRGFFDDIETRVNILPNQNPNTYLMDFIGLSATWTGHHPTKSDALKADPETKNDKPGMQPLYRVINEKPSIRMVGINCSFCHTRQIVTPNQKVTIVGGASKASFIRLYEDILKSVLALTINFENQLTDFLIAFDYEPKEAQKLANAFKKRTMSETRLGTKISLLMTQKGLINQQTRLFAKEGKNITRQLKRLLRLTHRIPKEQKLSREIIGKFERLALFTQGYPLFTTQGQTRRLTKFKTHEAGFGRLEAFISAGNIEFRDRKDWVNNDASVSYPAIWDIQDLATFHYTANTNSVLLRNIAQSVAIGGTYLDGKYEHTANVHNLLKLEQTAYKIEAPKWEKVFTQEKGDAFKIDYEKASRGQKHYEKRCAGCHTPQMAGPTGELKEFKMIQLDKLGTDPNLAVNIAKPVSRSTSYSNIFTETLTYIVDDYAKKYQLKKEDLNKWLDLDRRGTIWVRESYKKNEAQYQGVEDGYSVVKKGSGYKARTLKGVFTTAPYLHNGSVPTLYDLLQPASKRPVMFERGVNEFDPIKVGLKQRLENYQNRGLIEAYSVNAFDERSKKRRIKDCSAGIRNWGKKVWAADVCFDTRTSGNSNSGHEFGTDLKEYQKDELLEYLKTL
jgi:phage antirepressor YoqD-like protein